VEQRVTNNYTLVALADWHIYVVAFLFAEIRHNYLHVLRFCLEATPPNV